MRSLLVPRSPGDLIVRYSYLLTGISSLLILVSTVVRVTTGTTNDMLVITVNLVLPSIAIFVAMAAMLSLFLFGNRRWMIMAIGWFNRSMIPVRLINHLGDSKYSLARRQEDGLLHAAYYYMTNNGDCILRPDGLVDRASTASFVYFWLPLRKDQLVMHVMSNDLPDFSVMRSMDPEERIVFIRENFDRCMAKDSN